MKKQTTRIVAYSSLLLFLILSSQPIKSSSRHADSHKRWKKGEDEETTINRLEARVKSFPERSTTRRKGDNLLKKIHDLQEKQRSIPGETYRLIMDLKSLLADEQEV